jgi:hypothetical protein
LSTIVGGENQHGEALSANTTEKQTLPANRRFAGPDSLMEVIKMARIKIRDLPKDQKVSPAQMKKVLGGLVTTAGINLQARNLPGFQVLGIPYRLIEQFSVSPLPIPKTIR